MSYNRRVFLQQALALGGLCLTAPAAALFPSRAAAAPRLARGLAGRHLSPFFRPLADGFVQCTLCPHACQVGPGERGSCGVRENRDGRYYSLVYGNPCAVNLDPIEKKPFFHVLPATLSLSLATAGCNLHCQFCQNWEISQKRPEDTMNTALSPAEAVRQAKEMGARSLASTYVEPSIFFEYMLDLGREAKKAGLLKVMHSNGFLNAEPLGQLCEVLGAACVDLKSVNPDYYRQICGGELAPVQATLRRLAQAKVHTEIVHLMVPTLNDDPAETRKLIRFVHDELSPDTPVHFTRFYPRYKLNNLPPTPVETLTRARDLALEMGLAYAYVGNVPGHPGESTYCPGCHTRLIERVGYEVREVKMKDGRCPACGRAVPGIWA
ncbi:MAG: AmmeMemoRadiSam system radical SAM enzyme [Deltaproteobacteria bacterium]|nr:AmmeMemoRadiSam system radical SAM enzyme [Deltaproteobacteria bacterium]